MQQGLVFNDIFTTTSNSKKKNDSPFKSSTASTSSAYYQRSPTPTSPMTLEGTHHLHRWWWWFFSRNALVAGSQFKFLPPSLLYCHSLSKRGAAQKSLTAAAVDVDAKLRYANAHDEGCGEWILLLLLLPTKYRKKGRRILIMQSKEPFHHLLAPLRP